MDDDTTRTPVPSSEMISGFIEANRVELLADPEHAQRQLERFLERLTTLSDGDRESIRMAVLGYRIRRT
jgi:hypothetical protein